MKFIQIAIDGPAGAGKSSIAKEIAKIFNFIYIDTGAMYRALTYLVMKEDISFDDIKAIEEIAKEIDIRFEIINGLQEVYLGEKNITEDIRNPMVSKNVSIISAIPEVRSEMVNKQQKMAGTNNVVMDGRDIGTVVLPEALIKIFLTASPEERAKRRKLELESKGHKIDFNVLIEEIKTRDHMDETRATSPLSVARDAEIIDTTNLTFQEVLIKIKDTVERKVNHV